MPYHPKLDSRVKNKIKVQSNYATESDAEKKASNTTSKIL